MPKDTFMNLPDEKRKKIIAVGLEEFAQKGYDNASITNICAKSDIAKGSFYQYFDDKKDLFMFLLNFVGQQKLEYIGSRVTFDWADFFKSFRDMMLVGAEFSIVSPLYNDFATRSMDSAIQDDSITKMKQIAAEFFGGLVKEAQTRGQIRNDVPSEMIVMLLNAASVDFGKHVLGQAGVTLSTFTTAESQEKLRQVDLVQMTDNLIKLLRSGIQKQI